jgi:hypothetical protein
VLGAGLWLGHAEPDKLPLENGAGDLATEEPGVPNREDPKPLVPYGLLAV